MTKWYAYDPEHGYSIHGMAEHAQAEANGSSHRRAGSQARRVLSGACW